MSPYGTKPFHFCSHFPLRTDARTQSQMERAAPSRGKMLRKILLCIPWLLVVFPRCMLALDISSSGGVAWSRHYKERDTGVVVNTMRDRRAATNDTISGADVPFYEEDVAQARLDKRKWSFNIDLHIEEYANLYPATEGWWYRFEALGPIAPFCRQTEIYSYGDEEKRACGISQLPGPCVIISVGSNNQWSFETDVVKKTNCTVHTFDCTGIGKNWSVPEEIASKVTLHLKCLGSKASADGRFIEYQTMLHMAGVHHAPAYLKMDIEGWEWEVLRSMLLNSAHLLPGQIALELHYHNWDESNAGMPWAGRDKSYAELATFFDMLWRFGAYYVIDRNDNGSCTACSEILMVRLPHTTHPFVS